MIPGDDGYSERYEALKKQWRALRTHEAAMLGVRSNDHLAYDGNGDLAFAEMVDDMGGLDCVEEYITECLQFVGEGKPS